MNSTLENVYILRNEADQVIMDVGNTKPEVDLHENIDKVEDEDLNTNEVKSKQQQIDKMTLELLVNKRQYRKYLEKHNSVEYEQKQDNYMRFCKYKKEIGVLLRDLLNDYSVSGNSMNLGNTEIQEIFDAFIQKSTYFFETKEHDTLSDVGIGNDFDNKSDTLFGTITSDSLVSTDNDSDELIFHSQDSFTASRPELFTNQFRPGKSFWGKNVVKRK